MNEQHQSDTHPLIEERRDYSANTLRRTDLADSPVTQFTHWLQQARERKIKDATAMTLATSDARGQPHARIVLLKQFDETGFCWYTYQKSDKADQLENNPAAALLFYWCDLERQVRIEGRVEKLDDDSAERYFQSRPEGSRFSAAASIQSQPIDNRAVLERRVAELHKAHPNGNVPRPAHWGGYRLRPHRFEFWQGRTDRLHDRFVYVLEPNAEAASQASGEWHIQRISP